MISKMDENILCPHPNIDYGFKMWRAVITQSLVYFDPLPYDAAANDPLISGVDRPGNICDL